MPLGKSRANIATRKNQSGFSLVELGIVLAVLALLSAGAIAMLRAQTERTRILETREQLAEAREALIAYASANKTAGSIASLPCPATTETGLSTPGGCTGSPVSRGFLPWQTLGLVDRDPTGQLIRYAVSRDFSSTPCLDTDDGVDMRSKDSAGTESSLSSSGSVAFAVWSVGPDGVDASPTAGTKVIAQSPADDIVQWGSRFVLLGRLIEAGHSLPSSGCGV